MDRSSRSGSAARMRFAVGNGPSTPMGRTPARLRHFDVFRRVAYVDCLFRRRAQPLHRELNRRRMRLSVGRVLGTNACGKILSQLERAKLLPDAGAASAGDNSEAKFTASVRTIRRAPGNNGGVSLA